MSTPEAASPVRDEATRWSELPRVVQNYIDLSDKEGGGVGRLFSYASLITNPGSIKSGDSANLTNENATLPGMEVAMNVMAVGKEFRGASGSYKDAEGKEQYFANTGLYAGLQPAAEPGGHASGMNLTVAPHERKEKLLAYIQRELGDTPQGITPDDLFNKDAAHKFEALKGTPQDEFGMYKFQIVNAQTKGENGETKQVPAITVSTNDKSDFSAMKLTDMQAAHLILDGQGFRREVGEGKVMGGDAIDYFNSALGTARNLGLNQPRLEATKAAVEKLGNIWGTIGNIEKMPDKTREEKDAMIAGWVDYNRENLRGVFSPLFPQDASTNPRTVTMDDLDRPENKALPHTAEEKFKRLASVRDEKLGRG